MTTELDKIKKMIDELETLIRGGFYPSTDKLVILDILKEMLIEIDKAFQIADPRYGIKQ